MKNHFLSLFKCENIRRTIILAIIGCLLISVSLIIGTSDNIPMIAILLAGMIFLYFALLHSWKRASSFAVLTVVFFVLLVFDFIWPLITESIAMGFGFVCLAGIISGIIGIFSRIKGWQRLPYLSALLSLMALALISTNFDNPNIEQIAPMKVWILIIGGQLFATILLFITGLINKPESWSTKTLLIVATLILILLSIWGFNASTWQFGGSVNSIGFTILMFRLIGSIDIIVAALSLYAILKRKKS